MFPTDFGEPAALQLRRTIRTDDFGRADVPGVSQVLPLGRPTCVHEVILGHPCRIIAEDHTVLLSTHRQCRLLAR